MGQEQRPVRGVLLFVTALLFLACMDTVLKYLTHSFELPLLIAARYIGSAVVLAAVMAPRHGAALLRTRRTGLVILRGACLATSSLFFGMGLQRIGLAEATAIGFLAPILVMLAARPLLGEVVGRLGWIAAALGFSGVVLIARPGGGLDPVGVASVLTMVALAAGYQFLSRSLSRTETTLALTMFGSLVGSVAFGLTLPWFWPTHTPTWTEAGLLAALGAFGALGHYLLTSAYRYAPASLLAPANYVQLLWAGGLGILVFGHVPDLLALAGMVVIALSGILTGLRTRLARS